jgi:hypothetical protein
VHVTATTANLAGLYSLPESLVTARAADILEGMISRGFTTVRDAGGLAQWWACGMYCNEHMTYGFELVVRASLVQLAVAQMQIMS